MAVRRAAASCARVIVTALSRYYAEPLVRARIREYQGRLMPELHCPEGPLAEHFIGAHRRLRELMSRCRS